MSADHEINLGEFLRQEREKRNISIEQVASATKVGAKILHALENDHFFELPAKPFIRGFVTSYCRFLGLDAKEILSRYRKFIDLKSAERPNRESGHSGYAFEKKEGLNQSRMLLAFMMVSFICLGTFAILLFKPQRSSRSLSNLERLRSQVQASADLNGASVANGSNLLPSAGVKFGPVESPSPQPSNARNSQLTETAQGKLPKNALKDQVTDSQKIVTSPTVAASPVAVVGSLPNRLTASLPPTTTTTTPPPPSSTPAPEQSSGARSLLPAVSVSDSSSDSPNDSSLATAVGANPLDPLDSGRDLKGQKIQHKVKFQVNADVWVRFQIDQRPLRKFVIRKPNTLTLRAMQTLQFQVSNSKAVTFSYNDQPYQPMSSAAKNWVSGQPDATLHFAEKNGPRSVLLFTDRPRLPATPDPENSPSPSVKDPSE